MNEVWKEIEGFIGYYEISNKGRIKSLKRLVKSARSSSGFRTVNERFLKTTIDKYGYKYITLRKLGKDTHFTIHRLLAKAFISNPNNYPSINHVDENKLNNDLSNLEWCTVRYNNLYNERQAKINIKLRETVKGKIIQQYDLDENFIREYTSLRELARQTGASRTQVSRVCNGLRPNYRNYIWKYK